MGLYLSIICGIKFKVLNLEQNFPISSLDLLLSFGLSHGSLVTQLYLNKYSKTHQTYQNEASSLTGRQILAAETLVYASATAAGVLRLALLPIGVGVLSLSTLALHLAVLTSLLDQDPHRML